MSDFVLLMTSSIVYLAGVIPTYRWTFRRLLRNEIQNRTRIAHREGYSVKWSIKRMDMAEIRFPALLAAMGWIGFWPLYFAREAIVSRDAQTREEAARVAEMLSREMRKK